MKLYLIPTILNSIIISITHGDFNQFFSTSILPVNVQHTIKARRRRRSVYVFARGSGGQSLPANFIHFSVNIPPLFFFFFENR